MLLLIGLFAMLYLHTESITDIIKERINIIVELTEDRTQEATRVLGHSIEEMPQIKPGSTSFVSSSKAPEIMGQGINMEDFEVGQSPFKDVIIFNVKSDYYTDDVLAAIKADLLKNEIVLDVIYENVIVDNIKSNLNRFSFVILILTIFFLVMVIVIMYNTINLSMYADRWEIKTMEIIGARDRFIRQPYLKIAGRIALTSFVISSMLLLLILGLLYINSDFIENVLNLWFVLLSLLIIFLLSFIITISATINIVNKYIYTDEGDLYEE